MHIIQVMDGVHFHMHTCTRAEVSSSPYSEAAGRLALKFGVWLGDH